MADFFFILAASVVLPCAAVWLVSYGEARGYERATEHAVAALNKGFSGLEHVR